MHSLPRNRPRRELETRPLSWSCLGAVACALWILPVTLRADSQSTNVGTAARTLAPLPIQVDGRLNEPAWATTERQTAFLYPWSNRKAPATEFRAVADDERLYFAFEVSDSDVVVLKDYAGESTLDQEDRVEVFFARDAALNRYFCVEIDPLGRVHDYAASHYRKFDSSWNCPGLRAAGRITPGGYTVEASIPLTTLSVMMGRPVSRGSTLRIGLFRADFRQGAIGNAETTG